MLPGIDDGASCLADAIAMAEIAVADGIGTIVVTPHQLGNHAKNSGAMIREATARFQRVLEERRMPLRVLPGGDVRIEPDLPRKIRVGEVLTLADRRRHILLELPHEVYLPLDRLLADLAAVNMVGVLSHPERNRGILRQPGVLRPLVERGCLLQLTAGSLTGAFGSEIQKFTASLIEQGLVHFISTDAHSTKTRAPVLRPAFERVKEMVGENVALDLFCRNPRAVATGGTVTRERQGSTKSGWANWFCKTFSSDHAVPGPIR